MKYSLNNNATKCRGTDTRDLGILLTEEKLNDRTISTWLLEIWYRPRFISNLKANILVNMNEIVTGTADTQLKHYLNYGLKKRITKSHRG